MLYGDRSGYCINTILTCRNGIITLQKLYTNHCKINAEEAKIADIRKVILDCCWA